MTTKSRGMLIEQIRNNLAGGMAPITFNPSIREVGIRVDQVANAVIRINCENDGGVACGDYYTAYENVAILKDAGLNKYYCVLPAKVISLSNQKGVWQVSTMQDQSEPFTSIGTQGASIFKDDLYDLLQDEAGYYYEQGKLFFENYNPVQNTDTLLLKLIVDRSVFSDEEDYCVPPDIEDLIVEKVMLTYRPGK